MIQQALLQVLQPLIDPDFSEFSYGFRPGRRAHDAVCQAQRYVQAGCRVVVDLDLERFFDRVNHDMLMERYQGTPQGGPLLANVLRDEVDRVLERRGHRFVRYADDLNVYVRSVKAGHRVLRGLRKQLARLRLKVNEDKTAVTSAFGRKFLGFSFWAAPGGTVKRGVAANSRRWWRNSRYELNRLMPIAYFDSLGVPRLS